MRDQVKKILERELARIDNRSETRGLELDDFRTLDLLIKACKSFSADSAVDPDVQPTDLSPDELLTGIDSGTR